MFLIKQKEQKKTFMGELPSGLDVFSPESDLGPITDLIRHNNMHFQETPPPSSKFDNCGNGLNC